MRKLYRIIGLMAVLIVFLLLDTVSRGVFGEKAVSNAEGAAYEFPIQPGTEEWLEYDNKLERLNVLQIPDKNLDVMSTEALLATVLDYPYILDFYYFNSVEDASYAFSVEFNGFSELLSREDLSTCLISKYESTEYVTASDISAMSRAEPLTENKKAKLRFANEIIEFLISCDMKMNGEYSVVEQEQLREIIGTKAEKREALQISDSRTFFTELPANSVEGIVTGTRVIIETPMGSPVSVIYNQEPELTTAEKKELLQSAKEEFTKVYVLRDCTRKYNCHSYAWIDQSETNRYWLREYLDYTSDGSATQVYQSDLVTGNRVTWGVAHSGIVMYIQASGVQYVSKWGQGPLVRHDNTDHPYTAYNDQMDYWEYNH